MWFPSNFTRAPLPILPPIHHKSEYDNAKCYVDLDFEQNTRGIYITVVLNFADAWTPAMLMDMNLLASRMAANAFAQASIPIARVPMMTATCPALAMKIKLVVVIGRWTSMVMVKTHLRSGHLEQMEHPGFNILGVTATPWTGYLQEHTTTPRVIHQYSK